MSSKAKVADKVPTQNRRLECKHVVLFKNGPPKAGDLVFCYKCDDYKHVVPKKRSKGP